MKQPYVIVLAGNSREGVRYAKAAKLTKGRYRVVFSAKQIRRLRSAEIHELPSFRRRPDRHSINAALRYTRGERLQVTMPKHDGPTRRQLEVAHRYNRLRDAATPPDVVVVTSWGSEKPINQGDGLGEQLTIDGGQEPVKQEPKKRRTRCKVCHELVHGDDDPDHDTAAHEAQDAKVLGKPAPTPSNFFGGRAD